MNSGPVFSADPVADAIDWMRRAAVEIAGLSMVGHSIMARYPPAERPPLARRYEARVSLNLLPALSWAESHGNGRLAEFVRDAERSLFLLIDALSEGAPAGDVRYAKSQSAARGLRGLALGLEVDRPEGGRMSELRTLKRSIHATRDQHLILDLLCDLGGRASVADVADELQWDYPWRKAWSGAKTRLNKALAPHGWEIVSAGRRLIEVRKAAANVPENGDITVLSFRQPEVSDEAEGLSP